MSAIGESAFEGCASLEEVRIPSSVRSVSASAFHGCSSLGSVVLSDGIADFGPGAFSGCGAVAEVTVTLADGECSAGALLGPAPLGADGPGEAAANVLAREWRLPGQEALTVARIAVDGAIDLSDVAALEGRELVILSDGTSGGAFYGDDGETLLEGAGRALGGSRPFVPYADAPEPNAWRAVSVGSEDEGPGMTLIAAAAVGAMLLAGVAIAAVRFRRRA